RPGMRTAGRLRLVRRDAEIFCLFADAGSNNFEFINSYTVGNFPIKEVAIYTKRSDLQGKIDVLLQNLTTNVMKNSSK
ncbi:MAG: DUF1583 domain-containing protein, partial [Planctomycetota bacterium]|nr:DUF1583 domain-containing protein [Planctomycetota bacterium]